MAQIFSRDVIALEIALFLRLRSSSRIHTAFHLSICLLSIAAADTQINTFDAKWAKRTTSHWTAKSFTCPWTLNPSPMAIVIHLPLSLSRQSLRLVVNVQVSNKNSNLALNFIKSNQVQLDTRLLYVNIIFIELRIRGCFRASQNCTEHKWPRDYASNRQDKVRPARKF